MKVFLVLTLAGVVLLVWFRSRLYRRGVKRGRLFELLAFGLVLASVIGLIVVAGRLF